jgi:hypothetical protein
MLPREIVKKIQRIRITTNRLVDAGLGGEYHSVFRGRGMEFSEVRAYVPGDDVRAIDWNVTARTGVPHVKKFVEERDLTALLVDMNSRFPFILRGGRLYDMRKKPVKGVTGVIKPAQKTVTLTTADKDVQTLRLGEDADEAEE